MLAQAESLVMEDSLQVPPFTDLSSPGMFY